MLLQRERPSAPSRAFLPPQPDTAERMLSALAGALFLASWAVAYVAVVPPRRAAAPRARRCRRGAPVTLADFYALDPLALWRALSPERQSSIIVPLLTAQFAEVCQDDDGTDCSDAEQDEAAGIAQAAFQEAMDAIEAAFPEILAPDETALHGFDASMVDEAGKVLVLGLRDKRVLRHPTRYSETVKIRGARVPVGGFRNIAGPAEAPVWQAWTKAQVDAERLRRHPEMAFREAAE